MSLGISGDCDYCGDKDQENGSDNTHGRCVEYLTVGRNNVLEQTMYEL